MRAVLHLHDESELDTLPDDDIINKSPATGSTPVIVHLDDVASAEEMKSGSVELDLYDSDEVTLQDAEVVGAYE